MNAQEFLHQWLSEDRISAEDVLTAILPLVRETIEAHRAGLVAPLVGLNDLQVDQSRIWFEIGKRQPCADNSPAIRQVERPVKLNVEVLAEVRRVTDIDEGRGKLTPVEIGERGAPISRPVYLPGYVSWEHELEHHDPLTDIFSLGMILASLACQLDFNEPADLESFATHRRNLFALNSQIHPVIAQTILRMTELNRHDRVQDLPAILQSLEHYRDQTVSLDVDLARMTGFRTRDVRTKQQVVLTKLRDRLFDLSRRNALLHFRPTMQSLNLTQASVPLMLDIRNIRDDQILVWNEGLRRHLVGGRPIPLNKHLNFNEALYLPSLLERILGEARRDQNEFGFAQLRLVLCFLSWANLKEKPIEQYVSPLVLLPVRLTKNKGIRDTYSLEALSAVGEVNPVLRHQFRLLYNIDLPESIDLESTSLESLHEFLSAQIRASEPAVSLTVIDRPRIDMIHEKAKRRLDHYRRSARVAGRGVRHFGGLDYSYDAANFHPLGVKLFAAKVRPPGSHLREIIEDRPRPRAFAAPENDGAVVEVEKKFYQLRDNVEANPYLWNFDLCNLTLGNFHYRRMSLVRDFERILELDKPHGAFDATFSLEPRPVNRNLVPPPPLAERFDVVACDPTQSAAIAEARQGSHYIIQGPPGTGKSQTITNLIADFVARGKRVLFVCEKRAAIDVVYARLRQCGLGMLCALIHDSQTDKKEFVLDLKQAYERFLTDEPESSDGSQQRALTTRKLEQFLRKLEAFESQMQASLPDCSGLPVRRFLARGVELIDSRCALTPNQLERLPTYDQWWRHAEQLAALEQSVRDLTPDGVFSHHPLRRLAPALSKVQRPIDRLATLSREAIAALDQLLQAIKQSGIPPDQWSSICAARRLIDYARRALPLSVGGNLSIVESSSDRARQFVAAIQRIAETDRALERAVAQTSNWRTKLSPADLATALTQAQSWNGRFLAWLSPGWWRLRSALRKSYDFKAHVVRPTWVQILTALAAEYEARKSQDELVRQTRTQFELEDDPRVFLQTAESFRQQLPLQPDWIRRIHAALVKSPKATEFLHRMIAAEPSLAALSSALDGGVIDFEELPLDELYRELNEIKRHAHQVPEVLGFLAELDRVPPAIAGTLRQSGFTIPQAEAAIAYRTWDQLERAHRDLQRFNASVRNQIALRLEAEYDSWQSANAGEILRRVRERFLRHVRISNLTVSQLSTEDRELKRRYSLGRRTLEHEFGKTMRFKAIRELVESDSTLVIQDLKPVWLMSPLSVSDTLPLDPALFDVVIFDEASQVPLEESVPTLFRGRQVIVVGDEMQLPPTDFFSARQSEMDDELVVDENGIRSAYDLDSDSLLNHAARNLPSTMLGWHYRSRSESLISFSNWAFYDGRLLTVPDHQLLQPKQSFEPAVSAGADSGESTALLLSRAVSFHHLTHGVYDQRQNRAEAEYIAKLVRGILNRDEGLSIGVIAFSEAQQTEIERALNRLAQDDDHFRSRYEAELEREVDGQFVGLLVKNLENIQGDERDIIILSICYGPGSDGRILMNFGPINKSGGERRLNVAFSRAKRHMAIISTIRYSAITNDYNDGAACLKNYLRYAEALSSGNAPDARRVLTGISRWREPDSSDSPERDPVSEQLAAALRQHGYCVDSNVGHSHFRVDLAVRQADDACYRLGILIDGLAKYEHTDALEREMMRPRLLRAFGWRLSHVLAKDWYSDRDGTLQKVLQSLKCDEAQPIDGVLELDAELTSDDEVAAASEAATGRQDNSDRDVLQLDIEANRDSLGDGPSGNATAAAQVGAMSAGAKQVSVPAVASTSEQVRRYFEYKNDKSSKFWEITLIGREHTVRFGRIGSRGQSQSKQFADEESARQDVERLIAEKVRKGYCEVL